MIDPKSLRRTPHATEDGLQEGRPHPALRRYQADYRVVDWTEGMKLLGQRRKGDVPPIKGGVDDGSKEMTLEGAVLPDPFSKMHINPKAPIRRSPDPGSGRGPLAVSGVPTREELLRSRPGSVESVPDGKAMKEFGYEPPAHEPDARNLDPFKPSMSEETVPPDVVMPNHDRRGQSSPAAASEPRSPEPPAGAMADGARLASLEARSSDLEGRLREAYATIDSLRGELDRYRGYLERRVRVELQVSGMSFSVPAVDVVESQFGVVVLLPMKGDSMTFTPSVGADSTISCQQRGIRAEAAYTGTSFELEEFGLLGLAFMKRPDPEVPPRRQPDVASDGVGRRTTPLADLVQRLSLSDGQ